MCESGETVRGGESEGGGMRSKRDVECDVGGVASVRGGVSDTEQHGSIKIWNRASKGPYSIPSPSTFPVLQFFPLLTYLEVVLPDGEQNFYHILHTAGELARVQDGAEGLKYSV